MSGLVRGRFSLRVVVTTFDLDEYVHAALRDGACGFLQPGAVKNHIASAQRTLGVANRVGIAAWARAGGHAAR